ncbi:MAG: Unknown protein [uncultured Sulfurovum sp.]|uniref:DUF4145 domain-containing protein n=1 Tax=uncultured Sulfurovum sp. TaxID=269237 RepID=A0A6S6SLJ4_9BACT|nr:MAG: Unknown protein [uncultured Sulfurovum sp.]
MLEQNVPLLPESTMRYFEDSSQVSYPTYMRAVGIRNCLENIVNTVFMYLTTKESKEKWIKKTTLAKKIELTKTYFPDNIFKKIDNLRLLGNTVHPDTEEHKNLTHEEINLALKDISKVCEWVIITYLKKNGFHTNSWIPTMLSTLPPIYRVSILEELFDFFKQDILDKKELLDYLSYVQSPVEYYTYAMASGQMTFEEYKDITSKPLPKSKEFSQILLIIDKLAMAYLKNGDFNKSIEFINFQIEEQFINEVFKEQMIDKLELLEKERKNLPISQNLEQTKKYFKEILAVVKEDDYSLFITLFTAIVAQDELLTNQALNTKYISSE